MLPPKFIPVKPFPSFKWKWGSFQPTENLNDPLILLGIVYKLQKIEGQKFNSEAFAKALRELSEDVKGIDRLANISLETRIGSRNLMRNSGQYWKGTKLLAPRRDGIIELTALGKQVAERRISQSEFASIVVQTFVLPNDRTMRDDEVAQWKEHGVCIYPLRIILSIAKELKYITREELHRIVVPLSGVNATLEDYVSFIQRFRNGELPLVGWPDCTGRANDKRAVGEFLRFLYFFGMLRLDVVAGEGEEELFAALGDEGDVGKQDQRKYFYNSIIDREITMLLCTQPGTVPDIIVNAPLMDALSDNAQEMDRKRLSSGGAKRPRQANFRNALLAKSPKCAITNNKMTAVLEAAHIVPFRYNGEDTVRNGLMLRTDIHILFDSGHLRISSDGSVFYSEEVQKSYGTTIPDKIFIPEHVNREFLRWRWDNFTSL